jgi:hypothetical protein
VISTLLLLGACSPAPENLAVLANGPGTVGVGPTQRLLLGVRAPDGTGLASPDLPMELQLHFRDPVANEDVFVLSMPARFEWMVEGVLGIYVADVAFARPGVWVATLIAEDGTETVPTPFGVDPHASVPEVGDLAISVPSRTASGVADLGSITTDPDPDPDLYAISLDEALANGKPTVVAFATPAFCTSATCGPVVDTVKALKNSYPDVNWLHIEVYKNIDVENFADLELADAVAAWAFPTEPWVYVMDGDGVVVARFEGFVTPQELGAALGAANQ